MADLSRAGPSPLECHFLPAFHPESKVTASLLSWDFVSIIGLLIKSLGLVSPQTLLLNYSLMILFQLSPQLQ